MQNEKNMLQYQRRFCMNKIELLSPVGDWDCLLAAVQNGADSVYFGSTLFNARASANNFDVPTLKKLYNTVS